MVSVRRTCANLTVFVLVWCLTRWARSQASGGVAIHIWRGVSAYYAVLAFGNSSHRTDGHTLMPNVISERRVTITVIAVIRCRIGRLPCGTDVHAVVKVVISVRVCSLAQLAIMRMTQCAMTGGTGRSAHIHFRRVVCKCAFLTLDTVKAHTRGRCLALPTSIHTLMVDVIRPRCSPISWQWRSTCLAVIGRVGSMSKPAL